MKTGDRIRIVRGPYKGNSGILRGKVSGMDRAWFCRIDDGGLEIVYETEIRQGKEEA